MFRTSRPSRLLNGSGLAALTAILLCASGCDRPDNAPAAPSATATALPATEYFEGLTEEAFTATGQRLDTLIELARTSSARDRRTLSSAKAAELDGLLARISENRASMNRADLAIASVEAYRLFVSSSPTSSPIPTQVSLLDYAGFRFGADLNAQPVRWDDAAIALDYADAQWRQISLQVTDAVVRDRFANSLSGMRAALVRRDLTDAKQARLHELDLVDELETWFSRPGARTAPAMQGTT